MKKTNFSWRKAVVSQLFVVIEVGDDGLSRTPRIGVYEAGVPPPLTVQIVHAF